MKEREILDVPREKQAEPKIEQIITEPSSENLDSIKHNQESDRRKIEEVKDQLIKHEPIINEQRRAEVIAEYIKSNIPEHLKDPVVLGIIHQKISAVVMQMLDRIGKIKFVGAERVPQTGGFVMIANHTRFFDEAKLLSLIGRPAHIVAADMHAEVSIFHKWFMKAIGTLEVDSTLKNVPEDQLEDLMARVPKGAQAYYKKVINRDRETKSLKTGRELIKFLKSTTALLIKGEPVILFPEGLWLYEGNVMRKAYGGAEFIAKEYKRVTGKNLPIVPVGISDGKVTVGETIALQNNETIDDVMYKIADLLPEEERGYYKIRSEN